MAQDIMGNFDSYQDGELEEEVLEDKAIEDTNTVSISDKDKQDFNGKTYLRPKLSTLSKLSWLFDFPDINNNEHIDAFMKINECELYYKYYRNEIKWMPIRESIRTYLKENKDTFSRRLFFDMPVYFERYDNENKAFPVNDQEYLNGIRKFIPMIESENPLYDQCEFYALGYGNAYPGDLLFVFKRPLVIKRVPIEPEKAEGIIRYWNELSEAKYRYGYLRIYISIQKFQGWDKPLSGSNQQVPSFLSHIDGYRVYRDPTLQYQIYEKNFVYRR